MRTFIAIELNPAIKSELSYIQRELKPIGADVKWVKPGSMHLTLKFLGNIDQSTISDTKKLLDTIASAHKPFEITLFKIGGFPKLDNPRVLWVGIDKGCANIEKIADELGQDKERPFSAHLTLGRVKSLKNKNQLVEKIKALDFQPSASSLVDKIMLFQSTLTPQGPIYTPLHTSKFL